jgi:uncharacterized membrane protein
MPVFDIPPSVKRTSLYAKDATTLYFFAVVILAAVLRLYNLDFKSLWIDELYSIVPAHPINDLSFIIQYAKSDQPPLFFILLHGWVKLFSYTAFSGRLLVVFFGLCGVVAIYFLGKEIGNKRVGLFAGFLTAINYFHIIYSQELRFYSLLFCLTTVSFIFFIRSLKHKNVGSYVLYVISTVGLLYTQYFGIIIFLIQGFIFVCFVLVYEEKLRFILTGSLIAAIVILAFLPWLPTLINDSKINTFWIAAPKPYFMAVYYYIYWGKDVFTSIGLALISCLYVRRVYSSFITRTITREEKFTALVLASWIFFSYAIPYLRSIISTPMLFPRYTIIALPAIFIVMAMGFELIDQLYIRQVLVGLFICSTAINLFQLQNPYNGLDKAQWREASQAVISHYKPGQMVYSNQEWWYSFYFYKSDPDIRVIGKYSFDEKTELQPFVEKIESVKSFWVLSAEGMTGLNATQQQYVDRSFVVRERYTFYQSSATLYDRVITP